MSTQAIETSAAPMEQAPPQNLAEPCLLPEKKVSPWNSLEVVKLLVSSLMAVAIAFTGYGVTKYFRDQDEAKARRDAIQQLSRAILERRVRSEMLASSIRRHAKEPVATSLEEVVRRKKEYDDAYASWNTNIKAHMTSLRLAASASDYSEFEAFLQKSLTNLVFKEIDDCLTAGYDDAIRQRDVGTKLDHCGSDGKAGNIRTLLSTALNCGYALTEQPQLVSSGLLAPTDAASKIALSCPKWPQ